MGKPYDIELAHVEQTYAWALNQERGRIDAFVGRAIGDPLVVVGSGGSFSAATFATTLHQDSGSIAKAITPYGLLCSGNAYRSSHVLLLSAGGNNRDVLAALLYAVNLEPLSVGILSMTSKSRLSEKAKRLGVQTFEGLDPPSGKDGFLATNSLIATSTLLARAYAHSTHAADLPSQLYSSPRKEWPSDHVDLIESWTVLYGKWGEAAAWDIESKLTEAALANCQLADFRNFGHGRHHWFAKRAANSGILALSTPEDSDIAEKTINAIPDIPMIRILSTDTGAVGGLQLLVDSISLIGAIGRARGIDPGRPGIPPFGRRLYHLSPPKRSLFGIRPKGTSVVEAVAISRKLGGVDLRSIVPPTISYWRKAYRAFVKSLKDEAFGAIVLDYDGTLCDRERRFQGITAEMAAQLVKILEGEIIVGIATGRGQSVRLDLKRKLPEVYWNHVLIGYYNGSDIAPLSDDTKPDCSRKVDQDLDYLHNAILSKAWLATTAVFESRPNQISVNSTWPAYWVIVRDALVDLISELDLDSLRLLESGHSFDIVSKSTTKLNVVSACKEMIVDGRARTVLCIGDKGKAPGNDHELLGGPFTLSVDSVSPSPLSCWNLSKPGVRGASATLDHLENLRCNGGSFRYSDKTEI